MKSTIALCAIGLMLLFATGCSAEPNRTEGSRLPAVSLKAKASSQEQQVAYTVRSFYDAFNSHDFGHASEITTDDWNHINPLGGWRKGRSAVLRELEEVHSTFLRGVSDTPEEISVRFATPDVAVATVLGRVSTYTTPDGTTHKNERQIRTFVLVRRNGKWLIMQDQNTIQLPGIQ